MNKLDWLIDIRKCGSFCLLSCQELRKLMIRPSPWTLLPCGALWRTFPNGRSTRCTLAAYLPFPSFLFPTFQFFFSMCQFRSHDLLELTPSFSCLWPGVSPFFLLSCLIIHSSLLNDCGVPKIICFPKLSLFPSIP